MYQINYEWITLSYEDAAYDVCVTIRDHEVDEVDELDEVRPIDSEINITGVMDKGVMDWMLSKAKDEIDAMLSEPLCRSMSKKQRLIEGV